jgi:hypothetical protein
VAREETILAVTIWVLAILILLLYSPYNGEAVLWAAMMLVQSLPYIAALAMSLIATLGKHPATRGHGIDPVDADSIVPRAA